MRQVTLIALLILLAASCKSETASDNVYSTIAPFIAGDTEANIGLYTAKHVFDTGRLLYELSRPISICRRISPENGTTSFYRAPKCEQRDFDVTEQEAASLGPTPPPNTTLLKCLDRSGGIRDGQTYVASQCIEGDARLAD